MCKILRDLLRNELDFNDIYATWLPCNLHRLNDNSVKLLESLDPESYHYVRLSTVCQFDVERQIKLFETRARNIYKCLQSDKLNLLEQAMTLTNDRGIMVDLQTLGRVIVSTINLPKLTKPLKDRLKETTLDRWAEGAKKEDQEVVIEDKRDI